jgi:hypothetical protein
VLESFVWGETSREEPTGKTFTLMWSYVEKVWVTIYRLTVGVCESFMLSTGWRIAETLQHFSAQASQNPY